ncbi:MAG: hypothetical protein GY716_08880 [bacterium]|nr:hypothetical protein [bacterium]
MSNLIWSLEDLIGFTKSGEAEVRYWAVDRLVRHFPQECSDAIVGLLLDDHDATPPTVARHLGQHGESKHHAMLVRGFRLLRGVTPALCLQALARQGHSGVVSLAADALKRGDLTDPALGIIVESLADWKTPEAMALARDYIERKPELLVEPTALRGMLRIIAADEVPDLVRRCLGALHWRGTHRAGEAFRTLMDSLHIDDAAWCFRTGPSGHIELRKTIKAVESGYDCDILAAMGESTIKQIANRLRAGNLDEVIRALADWTCAAASRLPRGEDDDHPDRISGAVRALAVEPVIGDVQRLGQQLQQWLLGFHMSAAFAVARGQNPSMALKSARGNLEKLLDLAELETAHLVGELPAAIEVVCREDERHARKAQEWCLRMLEAQGPFFPKVMALETLGTLRTVHFIPEVIEYLSDENSYVYGAAERALSRMGEAIIAPALAQIEAGLLSAEAAHSILLLLCDLGTHAAAEAVVRQFDWFMDAVGPGTTAEWVGLFGTEELIEPLRDWLDEDLPMVGQTLLLVGAIHQVEIPESDEILRAIEDERARQADDPAAAEESDDDPASDPDGGSYVM